jgi:hypothetical protein
MCGSGLWEGRGTKINITDTHNNNTCDKYKSSLRHIHDPVLSSLKMKGLRLLFSDLNEQEIYETNICLTDFYFTFHSTIFH